MIVMSEEGGLLKEGSVDFEFSKGIVSFASSQLMLMLYHVRTVSEGHDLSRAITDQGPATASPPRVHMMSRHGDVTRAHSSHICASPECLSNSTYILEVQIHINRTCTTKRPYTSACRPTTRTSSPALWLPTRPTSRAPPRYVLRVRNWVSHR
jgi:hypothetical protein